MMLKRIIHHYKGISSGSSILVQNSLLLMPFVHKLMLPKVVGSLCDISAKVALVSEQLCTVFSLHMPPKISFVAKVLPSTSGAPPGPINLSHMHGHIRGNGLFPTCKIVIAFYVESFDFGFRIRFIFYLLLGGTKSLYMSLYMLCFLLR